MPPEADDAATLASARLVRREDLADLDPVTDEHNIFPYLLARSHLRTRSILVNCRCICSLIKGWPGRYRSKRTFFCLESH